MHSLALMGFMAWALWEGHVLAAAVAAVGAGLCLEAGAWRRALPRPPRVVPGWPTGAGRRIPVQPAPFSEN